ncbi:hypothetical protein U1Q18_001994, partial [Sarracenia purpurea var. burkii]
GFRKIDTDRWEFANDQFIKGQRHLLKNICRRKQSQVMVQRKSSKKKDKSVGECEEEEDKNSKLWKEVECLKTDKNVLMQELVNLRQHQQTSQNKLVVLREQLKGMEKNQQQMLSFIVMAMQSPGVLVQLLQPKDNNNWRMAEAGKSVLKRVTEDHEPVVPSDGMIVRYHPPINQSPEPLNKPTLDSEKSLELNLSSDEVRELFMNIDFMPGNVDDKLLSPESLWPIVIPDLPDDDYIMDQLLLSSPLSENKEDGNGECDSAEIPGSGMEIELTSCGSKVQEYDKFENMENDLETPQNLKLEKTGFGNELDKDQNMEIITGQMGLLASESNLKKHQNNFYA